MRTLVTVPIMCLIVFTVSCEFFNFESDRAAKVKSYFTPFKDLAFYDEWASDIGSKLPLVRKGQKAKPLKIMAHTIQCDKSKCFDTFENTKKYFSFKGKNFKKIFKKKLIKRILADGVDTCGVEFLALHRGTSQINYLKVLSVLRELTCDVQIVAQKTKLLPAWPKLKSKLLAKVVTIAKSPKKERSKKARWIGGISKKCRFIAEYKKRTAKFTKTKRRQYLFDSFSDPDENAKIDSCSVPSVDIALALRVHSIGFQERNHTLFVKPISLVLARGEIKIAKPHSKWGDLVNEILKSPSNEPTIAF